MSGFLFLRVLAWEFYFFLRAGVDRERASMRMRLRYLTCTTMPITTERRCPSAIQDPVHAGLPYCCDIEQWLLPHLAEGSGSILRWPSADRRLSFAASTLTVCH